MKQKTSQFISLNTLSTTSRSHLQRVNYEPVHFIEELIGDLLASRGLEVDAQVIDGPLPAVDVVVVIGALLNGNVRQVDEHVVQFVHARVVFHRAKTTGRSIAIGLLE